MVLVERGIETSFEGRAMAKIIAMSGGTWAVIGKTSLSYSRVPEEAIKGIFDNGITKGPITRVTFTNGYKEADYYPNLVWIVDYAYLYENSEAFTEQNGRSWEFIGAIPPQHISGVILLSPRSAFSGQDSEALSDGEWLAVVSKAEKIVKTNKEILDCLIINMKETDNPMPVYFSDGSLVWPQQLSLGQVESMVG